MISCNKDRMEDKIVTFSKFGDTGAGGITRLSLSPEALSAREEFCWSAPRSLYQWKS
ncbi:MAG: hypothetical protein ACK5MN_07500 [Lachnospiraceae bacterium]